MVHIKITKGLDIPIKGAPKGSPKPFIPSGWAHPITPSEIALNLTPFEGVSFKLLAKVGDVVKVGEPIAEDKNSPGRMFCSPAGGIIKEVRRGLKRVLQNIIIEVSKEKEEEYDHGKLDPISSSKEEILEKLKHGGCFSRIRSRPFDLLAKPEKAPKSIFVKASESAPFVPAAELQVEGYEEFFQEGLNALAKLTRGKVHLIYKKDSPSSAFKDAKNVEKHTLEGPHPISSPSLHIERIDPIKSLDDVIWTLNAHDVVGIGYLLKTGRYFTKRIISIAGPAVLEEKAGFFKVREGFPINALAAGHVKEGKVRFVSGDPLMGKKVGEDDFLESGHYSFFVVEENTEREFLHFFRPGAAKYSFSKAYLSGHLNNKERTYNFTTSLHGEHRAFIDSSLYDAVQPLAISTMYLVKAVMAEDFDRAEELGLLSVAAEDFALPTFVCPSKMEMTEIIKNGIAQYAKEMFG